MGRTEDRSAADAPEPLEVDELDRRLVREILAPRRDHLDAERTPVKRLAKTLDVHRNTVGSRVRRLREAGVFLPPVLAVDPSVVGHASGVLHMGAGESPAGDVDRDALFALDGVEALLTSLEGWDVPLHGRDPDEVRRRAEVVAAILDAETTRWVIGPEEYEVPEDPVEVTDLDARVVEAMLGDGRRAFREVAREVGVSPKTVRRRYRRLREAGALYFAPSGYEGARGATLVLVEIDTGPPPSRLKGPVLDLVDDVLFPNFDAQRRVMLVVWTPALARLADQLGELGSLDEVTGVRQRVLTATRTNPRMGAWMGPMLRDEPRGT